MEMRNADLGDMDVVMRILAEGREHQRKLGFRQWPDDYPQPELIESDINQGRGFVITDEGEVIAYVVIDANGDAEYDAAENLWKSSGTYAAVHRLAISSACRGKHLAMPILHLMAEYAKSKGIQLLRAETGVDNVPMQRTLAKAGYHVCGPYTFSWGPRIAYELDIK